MITYVLKHCEHLRLYQLLQKRAKHFDLILIFLYFLRSQFSLFLVCFVQLLCCQITHCKAYKSGLVKRVRVTLFPVTLIFGKIKEREGGHICYTYIGNRTKKKKTTKEGIYVISFWHRVKRAPSDR
jgi:hypothetical protein